MLRNYLPLSANNILFGNRQEYGLAVNETDPDWVKWLSFYQRFYQNTQKQGVGNIVNEAGYKILQQVDFDGKNVFELGPGSLPHQKFWSGYPSKFIAADVDPEFLAQTSKLINTNFESKLVARGELPAVAPSSVDVVLSFYSLEHLLNLPEMLQFFHRILTPTGLFIGAIPNEGGLAWGLGRMLTSRRYVKKHADFNFDKIICWEHPNFADNIIESIAEAGFNFSQKKQYPFNFMNSYDFNLVTSFICDKRDSLST